MKIRLLTRAQHPDGSWHDRGAVVDWPDDVRPPHGTQQKSPDKIDYDPANGIDANHSPGHVVDVPLFEEVREDGHNA